MKFIVLTSQYPSQQNLYANGFVHRRVLEYKRFGHEVLVYVNNNIKKAYEYSYEGVQVRVGNQNDLEEFIEKYNANKILVHFIDRHFMEIMRKNKFKYKTIVWIHGVEALGWYRRLFNINFSFLKYILNNTIQMYSLRKFVKSSKGKNIKFVYVSNWMKNIMEKDMNIKVNNYEIIPNIIDSNLFKFEEKDEQLRKNILLIRPFNSKKYANDIAIKAIIELSKRDFFNDLSISIFGSGDQFEKITNEVKQYKNVNLYNKFLTHEEIYEQHKKNGLFLCPTRQDSQGVSMCEAMSSGLVPISSNNTAIPEFVEHGVSGFLTNNYIEIADSIEYIYKNPAQFKNMSIKASLLITDKCSNEIVINRELDLMIE